jgi:ABC-type multidrug transport system fused ATPase/permease subunit
MTSFERVRFYATKLPQEKEHIQVQNYYIYIYIYFIFICIFFFFFDDTTQVDVPESWPSDGCVEFDGVSFQYRPDLPLVLRDVSFSVEKGEKIGVCGRTGAGKSSLSFVLFRLVELDRVCLFLSLFLFFIFIVVLNIAYNFVLFIFNIKFILFSHLLFLLLLLLSIVITAC